MGTLLSARLVRPSKCTCVQVLSNAKTCSPLLLSRRSSLTRSLSLSRRPFSFAYARSRARARERAHEERCTRRTACVTRAHTRPLDVTVTAARHASLRVRNVSRIAEDTRSDAVPRRAEPGEIGYAAAALGISHDEVRQVAYGRLRGRQTMPLPNQEIARRLLALPNVPASSRSPNLAISPKAARKEFPNIFHIFPFD